MPNLESQLTPSFLDLAKWQVPDEALQLDITLPWNWILSLNEDETVDYFN